METVEYKNISFTVWDVGGQDKVCTSRFGQNFALTGTGNFNMHLDIFTFNYLHFLKLKSSCFYYNQFSSSLFEKQLFMNDCGHAFS